MCVCVATKCARHPQRSEEGIGFPGPGLQGACELSCGVMNGARSSARTISALNRVLISPGPIMRLSFVHITFFRMFTPCPFWCLVLVGFCQTDTDLDISGKRRF